MHRVWKWTLAGVACALLAAGLTWVLAAPASGKLPTLPTPPGVLVPAGMRYVGGDEFNGPDGAPPAPTIWSVDANTAPGQTEVTLRDGCLLLSPNGSRSGMNSVTATCRPMITGVAIGRIDVRLRVPTTEAALRRQDRCQKLASAGIVLACIEITGTNTDTWFPIAGICMETNKPKLVEITGGVTRPPAYDGEFHTYSAEWRKGFVRYFYDGSFIAEYPNDTFVLPAGLRSALPHIPLMDRLRGWRTPSYPAATNLSITCGDVPPVTNQDRIRLEVDYVRIFQE